MRQAKAIFDSMIVVSFLLDSILVRGEDPIVSTSYEYQEEVTATPPPLLLRVDGVVVIGCRLQYWNKL